MTRSGADPSVDVAFIRGVLDRWWAWRELHEAGDGVDVDAVLGALRDELDGTTGEWPRAVVWRAGLWRLMDGHLRLAGTPWRGEGAYYSGLAFRPVADGVALAWVDASHGARWTAGVRPGDLLLEADDVPIAAFLDSVRLRPGSSSRHRHWTALESLTWQERFEGEEPAPRTVVLEAEDGTRRRQELPWRSVPTRAPSPRCVTGRMLTPATGLLSIRSFACRDAFGVLSDAEFARQLGRAAHAVAGARSLVVDVRGNGGGRDEQARLLAAALSPDPALEWMRYRHPTGPLATAEPRTSALGEPRGADELRGALATSSPPCLLVDTGSFSTTEILVAALRQGGRARVVGGATAGGAGNPVEFRLPRSGLAVAVPVTRYFVPGTDSPIEGEGLRPDEVVTPTAADLRDGKDPALDRAVELLDGEEGDPPKDGAARG